MLFMANLMQYIVQLSYWILLLMILNLVYIGTLKNKYASPAGKAIGALGGALLLIGADSLANAFFDLAMDAFDTGRAEQGIYQVHSFLQLNTTLAGVMFALGLLLILWGVVSWSFTLPEMVEVRSSDKLSAANEHADQHKFNSAGDLISSRITVVNGGLLSSPERFTEIETTKGVIVVEGEVGSVAKGLPVYSNALGKVRIGGLSGRTFYMRGASAAAK